ncbi:DUF3734 domain-containing protein [Paeniroseomonas aquatica]|jgi:NTE family protein|uniref:DUF3734 domain-containing protein n=1 Tax=Paeniroseomonas aquatica TaxID=373043 RepID=A0ABT8A2C0_9PROT|nr:DUF3734 domain-containing protein [Paeniroseomonas aquatica]MDN3563880.1 DUF3734 domain-containing protein [Paeniroseomonas aquatica]
MNTNAYTRLRRWQLSLRRPLAKVPEERLDDDGQAMRRRLDQLLRLLILQVIYQRKAYEEQAQDCEFGAETMREHWASGLEDTRATLCRREWLRMPEKNPGIAVQAVHCVPG